MVGDQYPELIARTVFAQMDKLTPAASQGCFLYLYSAGSARLPAAFSLFRQLCYCLFALKMLEFISVFTTFLRFALSPYTNKNMEFSNNIILSLLTPYRDSPYISADKRKVYRWVAGLPDTLEELFALMMQYITSCFLKEQKHTQIPGQSYNRSMRTN